MKQSRWEKIGNLFAPEKLFPWLQTHASTPVAEHVKDNIFRIYFSGRDSDSRSSIGYVVIDIEKPGEILELSDKPVVSPGEPGMFDDSGASVGCTVVHDNRHYLFYVGWNLAVTVPWRNSIGLSVSEDGKKFNKHSTVPVLDRNRFDPYSLSYPYVLVDNGTWKMWYGSNLGWGQAHEDMRHVIKYAESSDGLDWKPTGEISVNFASDAEFAIARPSVIKENNIYRMWFSCRGQSYRIGYAESEDGIHFDRMDHVAGIDISATGWDSESIEYPNVIRHRDRYYLFYNGNGYGLTGFGLAVMDA